MLSSDISTDGTFVSTNSTSSRITTIDCATTGNSGNASSSVVIPVLAPVVVTIVILAPVV